MTLGSTITTKSNDKTDARFSSSSLASTASTNSDSKKRDVKRRPRKRGGSDDEYADNRDLLRKKRRNQDGGEFDEEDVDLMEMMNIRGHSPSEREIRQRFEPGPDSDFEGSSPQASMLPPPRRPNNNGGRPERPRPIGRTSPRRRTRGNSRERERDRRRTSDRERDRGGSGVGGSGGSSGGGGGSGSSNNSNNSSSSSGNGGGATVSGSGGRLAANSNKNTNTAASSTPKGSKDESICAFYMEGKCSRGSDCPYSHAALPPRKMELCKFYMMDCCAKKDKCLYMHKDFPCKYFQTGRKCRYSAEDCKFSHDSLSETTRAILIKHIETAPREILGDFPRLTRDETIQAIDNFSSQGSGRDKRPHIPSLFELQLAQSSGTAAPAKLVPAAKEEESEDRNSNGADEALLASGRRLAFYQDTSIADTSAAVGTSCSNVSTEENRSPENSRSIWFGQLRVADPTDADSVKPASSETASATTLVEESASAQHRTSIEENKSSNYLAKLPRRQRELYLRIQQQQREPVSQNADADFIDEDRPADDRWYSSDEEGTGRSFSDIIKSIKQKPESQLKVTPSSAATATTTNSMLANAHQGDSVKPVVPNLNLGSLDNINVAEIAKALSTLQAVSVSTSSPEEPPPIESVGGRRDPRIRETGIGARTRVPTMPSSASMGDIDLRMQSRLDIDLRIGSADVDLRSGGGSSSGVIGGNGIALAPLGSLDEIGTADIDLRRFGLPFKPVPSHAPAREIEASLGSHVPFEYQVHIIDCEPLNYSLIRVRADWAHLDPRLQRDPVGERTSSYCGSDTPSIPLGPASPDLVMPTRVVHYEPELPVVGAASTAPTTIARRPPNDPRTRDPRRAAAAAAASPLPMASNPVNAVQQQTASIPDSRGKLGLLGAAPPGMMPYGNKSESSVEAYGSGGAFRASPSGPYDRIYESSGGGLGPVASGAATGGGQHSPRAENLRDPRQRLRNPVSTMVVADTDARSYTPPPPNERLFR